MVQKINETDFQKENTGLVLVDFYADWCGPCKMLGPILDDVSEKLTFVKFLKVDVDKNRKLASQYGVQSIPTVILFKNGMLVDKRVGFMAKDAVVKWLEAHK